MCPYRVSSPGLAFFVSPWSVGFNTSKVNGILSLLSQFVLLLFLLYSSSSPSSSSISTTARCGLWPVEQFFLSVASSLYHLTPST